MRFAFLCLGVNGICEEDELVIDEALDGNVFHFLKTAVVAVPEFHKEVSHMTMH